MKLEGHDIWVALVGVFVGGFVIGGTVTREMRRQAVAPAEASAEAEHSIPGAVWIGTAYHIPTPAEIAAE